MIFLITQQTLCLANRYGKSTILHFSFINRNILLSSSKTRGFLMLKKVVVLRPVYLTNSCPFWMENRTKHLLIFILFLYFKPFVCFAFHFKVEIRYNLPSSRGEICKFDLKTTVKETKDESGAEHLQDNAENNKRREKEKRKKPKKGRKKRKGKRCKKLRGEAKKRCKNKGKPQKFQPVIVLKVCTR